MIVYGVFSGQYSDWSVHGYFDTRDEAEKYCAKMNLHEDKDDDNSYSYYDNYYVVNINKLNADLKDIKLRYYHEVVFDFKTGMRNEPERYEYYIGEKKPQKSQYNLFRNNDGWVSFAFDCENRKKAEKIAQDKYAMFINAYNEFGSYKLAAESFGINKL